MSPEFLLFVSVVIAIAATTIIVVLRVSSKKEIRKLEEELQRRQELADSLFNESSIRLLPQEKEKDDPEHNIGGAA